MALFWVRTGSNGTGPDVDLDDLGITIATSASWTVLSEGSSSDPSVDGYGQFTARELRDSNDLSVEILAGNLEFSLDGLSEANRTYISDIHIMQDFLDDYLDLAAGRLTIPNEQQPPSTIPIPVPGDIFYDTDDGYLVFYSGVINDWVTITDAGTVTTEHGNLVGLADDDHAQYLLLSGNAARNTVTGKVDFGTDTGEIGLPKSTDPTSAYPSATAGDLAYDTDDGYVVFYDGANWIALESATAVNDHGTLSGLGDDDHTQYSLLSGNAARNAVTGEFDFGDGELRFPVTQDPFSAYPLAEEGNVAYDQDDGYIVFHNGTEWIQVIDTLTIGDYVIDDHGLLNGLLDDDHTQYGLLAGDLVRNTVTGTYNFGDGYLVAPTHSAAPAPQADGEITFIDGVLYGYDSLRGKWLSVDRTTFIASKKGNANDVYLRLPDGIATSQTGVRALRDGTIVGISAQTDDAATWDAEVHTADTLIAGASVTVTAATGDQDDAINADFTQGDELQVFANTTGNIRAPVVYVEIAWRA